MTTSPIFDEACISARRMRAQAKFNLGDGILVVGAGQPISVPGGHDRTFPFGAHPEYYWLSGIRRAGGAVVFDPSEGWTHFVEPVSALERLWEGAGDTPPGRPMREFADWLSVRAGRPIAALGSALPNVTPDAKLTAQTQQELDAARRAKDDAELALMRRAAAATLAGHRRASALLDAGVSERALQIELEAEMFRGGGETTGYETIVASGPRSAILHGLPTSRRVQAGEFVLIDAGGAIDGYTADVTRTFCVGAPDSRQLAIYAIVEKAMRQCIAECRSGVEWHDVHRSAATIIAAGLVELGLLRGEPAELANSGVASLFFPHGIGHLVGLGVRDVGGRALGREAGRITCGARVRVDLPLEPGFIVTVEPGIYFVDALLDDPERRQTAGDAVNWPEVDKFRGIGGVRLEDNVVIRADGPPENLTGPLNAWQV